MQDLRGGPECPAEIRELRQRVADFVHDRVVPSEPVLDRGGPPAAAALRRLRQQAKDEGLWALPLPVEIGGQGLPLRLYAPIAEVEGASDHGPAALGSASLLDAVMMWRHGMPSVRESCAERLVAGEVRAAFAMTEPGTPGTEPTAATTRAVLEPGGTWRISGRKWFTSGAADADFVTVLARTDGEHPARRGLSLLLVPTAAPGFRVVRDLPVLGASGQAEIELTDVRVPLDHLIGARGQALTVARERLQLGRVLRSLRWLGQAWRAFALLRDRAASRAHSSARLGDLQLVQRHVFEALLALRTTGPLVYEAAARLDAGLDAHLDVGLAKVAAARTLEQVSDAAIQVYGAEGLGPDTALPALFRAGRAARILDGPDELHIVSVARRVLRPAAHAQPSDASASRSPVSRASA
ncbi:acyl-CoA dehydrogenase family protein [Streptomyces sp. SID3343]|uniref:acyl-CoA dehydrogenase family protein n=1 Tax=Streptomyces sp. SID3343 TaxID=2690260 RepID=UPI00136F2807|nr:acyl-CoA dehydrogenase family protein [Streptomyces sp. SID3343]MYW03277.1 acyl-CoA dehydrogenase [Streptomyces sp. SID3343]